MRTAIWGIGSLGTIIGALLTQSGQQVDLIDSWKDNVDALNKNGATITGGLEMNVPVKALLPADVQGVYDLIILLTKQTNTAEAMPFILPHLGKESIVCTLQNGIPEELVASFVGKERTMGAAVGFGATWLKPGVSSLTSAESAMRKYAFELGEMSGEITPRVQKVKDILSAVGTTTILTNLMGIRWTKLLANATFSGMSAALGCTFGDVLDHPKAMIALAHIANEAIEVCHSRGYKMITMYGLDMERLAISSKADVPARLPLYHQVWDNHRALKASMLQDLEKGRPCEIGFINGVVVDYGKEAGIKTPFNSKVVELVRESEASKRVGSMSDLSRFDEIIAAAK